MTDLSSPLSVIQAAPSVSLRYPDTQLYEDLDVFVSRKKMSFKYWDPGILIIHQAGEYRSYIKIQRFDDYEKSVSRTVMTPKGLLG